jgi:hypothetical protein
MFGMFVLQISDKHINKGSQQNHKHRTLTRDATCQRCGVHEETVHHAVVRWPKAAALRFELRHFCDLPDKEQFRYSGTNWLLFY